MNTINEMCLAWYVWVNGNYDILIMTITLIVVAGLVLEVVRLKTLINTQKDTVENSRMDIYRILGNLLKTEDYQVKVNVHLAKDIAELQKKVDLLGKVVGGLRRKAIKK